MSTAAEIAAGRQLASVFAEKTWDEMTDDQRTTLIVEACEIVRAYRREAWREPTAEDRNTRKPLLTTYTYMSVPGKWSEWAQPYVSSNVSNSKQYDIQRVQDLPPLPEPRS